MTGASCSGNINADNNHRSSQRLGVWLLTCTQVASNPLRSLGYTLLVLIPRNFATHGSLVFVTKNVQYEFVFIPPSLAQLVILRWGTHSRLTPPEGFCSWLALCLISDTISFSGNLNQFEPSTLDQHEHGPSTGTACACRPWGLLL